MEVDLKPPYVFQVDSEIVQDIYINRNNYLISYNKDCTNKNTCAIYFSSNDIYFPNAEHIFKKRIIDKDFFEWYGTRVQGVYKHILLRDVHKQFYLSGINTQLNSPEKLLAFLTKETLDYSVTTIGSSSGGYAAVLYGALLKANKVIAFNPLFEINSKLTSTTPVVNPFIFRYQNLPVSKYFDLRPLINSDLNIFYFYSIKSPRDIIQYNYIKDISSINVIPFKTKHHGIPFLKSALNTVLSLSNDNLKKYAKSKNSPLFFTIRMIGLTKTIQGITKQLINKYKKRR